MSELNTCYFGDVRDGLRAFAASGVKAQTCVTSPPYWGLRDYGTAEWEGGTAGCKHGARVMGNANKGAVREVLDGDCYHCGARRIDKQIGLEPTMEAYVHTMVEVFRLVRDLLADDGTLWLNLGDSYAANRGYQVPDSKHVDVGNSKGSKLTDGLKAKDLCGIPWRVALALQADGWFLRQDIIWSKPNPMPESVTDRCTKAHEYLFLMSKRERYYFDATAIAEPAIGGMPGNVTHKGATAYAEGDEYMRTKGGLAEIGARETRNRRSVWTVNTEPFAEAHFATFPTALVQPCIAAGTSERGHCVACGKAWRRITERGSAQPDVDPSSIDRFGNGEAGVHRKVGGQYQKWLDANPKTTTGWQPTCDCGADAAPGVVLDPFMGSGTVAQVAQNLGRNWIGCELNPEYIKLQRRRAAQTGLVFA